MRKTEARATSARIGRRIRLSITIVVAVAMAAAMSGSAMAAQGSYGSHYGQASCYTTTGGIHQLFVPAPQIFASPATNQGNVFTVGSQHNQLVAYKVNVFFSTDAANWRLDTSSSWRAGWVGDGIANPLPPASWWDYDRGAWVSDTLGWNLNTRGYYRAAIEFYWFQDNQSGSGYDYLWADHFDYSSTNLAAQQYCAA